MYKFLGIVLVVLYYFSSAYSDTQQPPEINDQFEVLNHTEVDQTKSEERDTQHVETNTVLEDIVTVNKTEILDFPKVNTKPEGKDGFIAKLYLSIKTPIAKFISIPKINAVMKNVATCIVNGVMEIVTFYFPAPMIPLIASAAGLVMPFEPVVTLRRRMPVASYRRAFNAAVDSFVGTFDPYKKPVEDPYMTRRFNRILPNDDANASDQIRFNDKNKNP